MQSISFSVFSRGRVGAWLALIVVLLASLSLAGCGRSASKADAAKSPDSAKGGAAKGGGARGGGGGEAPPIAVTTATATARDVPTYFQATGSLLAQETSDVASQTSGQVISTPVSVGAFVRQGQTIARLNDRDARLRLQQAQAGVAQALAAVRQAEARLGLSPGGNFIASNIPEVRAAAANYEQAQAQLRLAQANEARYRQLVETGDVARSVYDQYRTQRDTAQAQATAARQQLDVATNTARQSNQAIQSAQAGVESARSAVAIAQKAVADTIIRAPYAGYISNRPAAVGEYVTPASVVATVLRTNPLKMQLQVPESEVPSITPGMSVSLEVEAHRDKKFSGRVTDINPAIDPVSRAATVEAEVENSDNSLRSGMFATARILRSGGTRVVFVPKAAVVADQNTQSYRLFVIQNGVAHLRVAQVGQDEGDAIQIITGVNADEVVATANLDKLYEGARVQIQ